MIRHVTFGYLISMMSSCIFLRFSFLYVAGGNNVVHRPRLRDDDDDDDMTVKLPILACAEKPEA